MSNANLRGWPYFKRSLVKNWSLYVMILPVLLYFAIFVYWPMYGVLIAFQDYLPGKSILNGNWVGFKHFKTFFTSIYFARTMGNTITLSLYSLVVNFFISLVLAILMNEIRSAGFKKSIQTITYLPHFISTVVLCGMIWIYFRAETGMVNIIIQRLGGESVNFLNTPKYFKHLYVWSGVWQHAGWGTIIYMATLSGLDVQMYEAADIDGATKVQRIRYITLPSLLPTAILLLILDSGSILSVGFEKVFLLQTDLNRESSDVISTLVYRKGILETSYSYSAAVGLFNSVVNCVVLLVVNGISKKLGDTSLF